jgi:hypothetical protein
MLSLGLNLDLIYDLRSSQQHGQFAPDGATIFHWSLCGCWTGSSRRQPGEDARGVRKDATGTGERVRQPFAHMANDHLQGGQAVKEPGDDQPKRVQTGFGVSCPARTGKQTPCLARQAGEAGAVNRRRRRRRRRVKVDGHAQMHGGLKNRQKAAVVKKQPVCSAV